MATFLGLSLTYNIGNSMTQSRRMDHWKKGTGKGMEEEEWLSCFRWISPVDGSHRRRFNAFEFSKSSLGRVVHTSPRQAKRGGPIEKMRYPYHQAHIYGLGPIRDISEKRTHGPRRYKKRKYSEKERVQFTITARSEYGQLVCVYISAAA